jgi:hypothetical protein
MRASALCTVRDVALEIGFRNLWLVTRVSRQHTRTVQYRGVGLRLVGNGLQYGVRTDFWVHRQSRATAVTAPVHSHAAGGRSAPPMPSDGVLLMRWLSLRALTAAGPGPRGSSRRTTPRLVRLLISVAAGQKRNEKAMHGMRRFREH